MNDVRLIDANALKVRMFRSHEFNRDTGSFDLPVVPWHDVEDADTIDAVPVVHARWVWTSFGWCCSACNKKSMVEAVAFAKYCHRCGAKMDASTKDEEE